MGRSPGNPLTPQRQVGAVYPSPQDEPVCQGRDSSQGLLIASGIFKRLVPGSPATTYLGSRKPALKLVGTVFKQFGKPLQRRGETRVNRAILARPRRGRVGRDPGTHFVQFQLQRIALFRHARKARAQLGFNLFGIDQLGPGPGELGADIVTFAGGGLSGALHVGQLVFQFDDPGAVLVVLAHGKVALTPGGVEFVAHVVQLGALRHGAVTRLVQVLGDQQRGEQHVLRFLRSAVGTEFGELGIDQRTKPGDVVFLPVGAGDGIGLAAD